MIPPLTVQAQAGIREVLRPGETAVDATAGNGHDTLFLAQTVGPMGRVYAFDVQPLALERTAARLAEHGIRHAVLLAHNHAEMRSWVPTGVGAVMFNLGYLPGADHALATDTASTLAGLDAALSLLRLGGRLSVICYPGPPRGAEESAAVERWVQQLGPAWRVSEGRVVPGKNPPPRLYLVERLHL